MMNSDEFQLNQQYQKLPAQLPKLLDLGDNNFYTSKLMLEKIADRCWKAYYVRHWHDPLIFGKPEIVSGTEKYGSSIEESMDKLLKELNSFSRRVEDLSIWMNMGAVRFQESEKFYHRSELLHRDYSDLERAALRCYGITNELIKWMYKEGKYSRSLAEEDTPHWSKGETLYTFLFTQEIIKKHAC